MVKNPRKGILLGAAGLVAGVALGAMGMMSLRGGDGPYASSPPATRSMGAASAPASTYVTAVSVHCEMPPILPAGGEGDGTASLQARPAAASAGEVGSLILGGKEAAAAGRPRDAEIGFLNACRNAAVLQDGNGVPLADAMYQLGRHYATVAAFGSPKAKELLQRAERLYSASLEGYRTRLGPTHEKTKFAQEGLLTVQQGTGTAVAGNSAPAAAGTAPAAPAPAAPAPEVVAAPVAPAAPPAPAAAVAAAPAPAPVPAAPTARASVAPTPPTPPVARAPAPAPAAAKPAQPPQAQVAAAADAPAPARRASPSFNCAQARSTTEKLICGDEELARMDRELGALHQRAREASPDPRAFQRNSDAEWQRREETCRDRECLQRWYAQRRAELGAAARTPAPAPAPAPTPRAAAPEKPRPEATRQPAAEPQPQPQPRPRRAPARTATAEAPEAQPAPPPRTVRVAPPEPEFDAPPPPPRSSAMGGNAGEVPTAEGSTGSE